MKYWEFRNEAGTSSLYIYGEISDETLWGEEVTPKGFKEELDACRGTLDVYINSGGGSVFAGQAIYTMLRRYEGSVVVHIDGVAASIAAVIAMAGDRIIMPENGMMMIHNAWARTTGDATKMRKMADTLEKLDGTIRDVFASKTGKDADLIAEKMAAETWFNAAEALEIGLIDEIEAGRKVAASIRGDEMTINGQSFDLKPYKNPPRNAVESVEIVYGPPCSGKSTYVRERAKDGDLIYDYDALVRAMTPQDKRDTQKTVAHEIAIGVRGLMINRIAETESGAKRAYIITRWPTDNLREQLNGLDVTEHRMDATREECLDRLEHDDSRDDKSAWAKIIDNWFSDHANEPDNGGEGQPVEENNALNIQRSQFQALRRKILETTND